MTKKETIIYSHGYLTAKSISKMLGVGTSYVYDTWKTCDLKTIPNGNIYVQSRKLKNL